MNRRAMLVSALCLPFTLVGAEDQLSPFEGTWKMSWGGKTAVSVTLKQERDKLVGRIGIANMRGDENGSCVEVYDEPDEKHAMLISSAKVESRTLRLEARNGHRFDFKLTGDRIADLTFLNTDASVNPVFHLTRSM